MSIFRYLRSFILFRAIVTLYVRDFSALEIFECKANSIMKEYQGVIKNAFETKRNVDGSGEEVHFLEFASVAQFERYRADVRLNDLAELKKTAITSMDVTVVIAEKSYE